MNSKSSVDNYPQLRKSTNKTARWDKPSGPLRFLAPFKTSY